VGGELGEGLGGVNHRRLNFLTFFHFLLILLPDAPCLSCTFTLRVLLQLLFSPTDVRARFSVRRAHTGPARSSSITLPHSNT